MTCRENGHFKAHLLALSETLNGMRPDINTSLDTLRLLLLR